MFTLTMMALRYLGGRKLRTTLTTLAIVFGVSVIFGINLLLPSTVAAFKKSLTAGTGTADLEFTIQTGEAFEPGTLLASVAKVGNVEAVSGVLRRLYNIPSLGGQGTFGKAAQLELIGVDPDSFQKVQSLVVNQGRFLQAGDSNKAVIPAGIVELAPQLGVGATIPLITSSGIKLFTVVGTLADRSSIAVPQVYVTLPDAQQVFSQPGFINSIEIAIQPGADRTAVAAEVQKTLGERFKPGANSSGVDAVGSLEIAYAMFNLLGLMALLMGAFLIFNTFRTVIMERRHDLAMLRTIGAERGQLTQLILMESLLQGIIGTAIGLLFGLGIAAAGISAVKGIGQQFFGSIDLQLSLSPSALIGAIVLGVGSSLVAGYFPARAAGKVSPLEALRPVSAADNRRNANRSLIIGIGIMVFALVLMTVNRQLAGSGALLFLIGMLVGAIGLVVPLATFLTPVLNLWFNREGDLARGNMIRQPGRAAITASTLMIGLAVFIVLWTTAGSFNQYTLDMVHKSFTSDLLLLPQTIGIYGSTIGADESLVKKLQALPEVQTASGFRFANSIVGGKTLQVLGINPETYDKVSPMEFQGAKPSDAYAALGSGRTMFVNPLAASTLKVKIGDSVTLETPEGPQTYQVVALASDLLTFKVNTAFISQANIKTDFHKADDVMLMVDLKPGVSVENGQKAVAAAAVDYPQFTVRPTGQYATELSDVTTKAIGFFYFLGFLVLIPAALGLLNTLTINVLERTREIGVIRAVGGSRTQVRRIVMAEAVLLGLFGALIGTVAGAVASYGFIAAFAAIGWNIPYDFPILGILAAIICATLLALLASMLPARRAAGLDIIRALQYE